jgi:hypothetical protein
VCVIRVRCLCVVMFAFARDVQLLSSLSDIAVLLILKNRTIMVPPSQVSLSVQVWQLASM